MDTKKTYLEKIVKSQDYIYLKENYIKKPKEQFYFLEKEILKKNNEIDLLDLGCAKGEFIYFLSRHKKIKNLTGIDYSQSLIKYAKSQNRNTEKIKFYKKKAENFSIKKKFDFIIISGLISYFDDPKKIIKCSINHLKKNGIIIILDKFNENNVDILVSFRNNKISKKFEKGWNFHSIKTLSEIFKQKNFQQITKKKFKLKIPLKPKKDPGRSFKLKTNYGDFFANGLNQFYNIILLAYKRKK